MSEFATETAPPEARPAPPLPAETTHKPKPVTATPSPVAAQMMSDHSLLQTGLSQNEWLRQPSAAVVQRARKSVAADSGDKPKFEIYVPGQFSYNKKELTGNDAFKFAQQINNTFVSNNMPGGYALKLDHKNRKWFLVGPLGVSLSEAKAVVKGFKFKGKVVLRGGPKPKPVIQDEPVTPDPGPIIPDDPVIPDPIIPDDPVIPDPNIPDDPVIPDPVLPEQETTSQESATRGFAPKITATYLDNEGNVTRTDDADTVLTSLGKVKRVEYDQLSNVQKQAVGSAANLRSRVNSLEAAAALDRGISQGLYGAPAKIAAMSAGEAVAQGTIDWQEELSAGHTGFARLKGLLQDAGFGKEDFPKLLDKKVTAEDSDTDDTAVPEKASAKERLQPYSGKARQLRQALGYVRAGELWNGLSGYGNSYNAVAGSLLNNEALSRRNTSPGKLEASVTRAASNGGVAMKTSALTVSWLGDKAHRDFWSGKTDALK
ncbi:hypothetical protein [Endozoicomonas lisbonensis]|uniref:BMFP domain-containing protein YqiC n=1 Tax=Endozoicomonas lisbonensis TaxID=3120522 RepID=A0ABV2SAX9_9GAMM